MSRVPDAEVERCLLASCLHSRSAWIDVGPIVTLEMFYAVRHRILWSALGEFYVLAADADLPALWSFMERRGSLADAGGRDEILSIHGELFAGSNARMYAEDMRDRAVKRWYAEGLTTAARLAADPTASVDDIEAKVTATLQGIAAGRPSRARSFSDIIGGAFQDLLGSRIFEDRAVPTGFYALDQVVNGGFSPGQLIILAARPSVGKSSMAYAIAMHVACTQKRHVALFSLEVDGDQIAKCMIASTAAIRAFSLSRGNITEDEKARLIDASSKFANAPLTIDGATSTAPAIASVSRSLHHAEPLALVIVDYIGLVAPGKELENRQNEVSFISRSLKMLAKELDVPILALAQLNREVEKRVGGRPTLADLRDSGSLEQDADVVLMIHRYQKEKENVDRHQLLVMKNRHGEAGREIEMDFEKPYLRWSTRTKFEEPQHDEA